LSPAPSIPAPSASEINQKEVINRTRSGPCGQLCWPPLGRSHDRQRALFTAATGHVSLTVDRTTIGTRDMGSLAGARIAGRLDCRAARLSNGEGVVLDAQGARIGQARLARPPAGCRRSRKCRCTETCGASRASVSANAWNTSGKAQSSMATENSCASERGSNFARDVSAWSIAAVQQRVQREQEVQIETPESRHVGINGAGIAGPVPEVTPLACTPPRS
jgi:hypothetical protein